MEKKYLILTCFSLFILSLLFITEVVWYNDGKLHVVFCDVGQGDAIFIKTPTGSKILIDGGPDESVLKCLSKHMLFFDRKIDVVMLTHPHADHLTGLISVVRRYDLMSYDTENVKISAPEVKILEDYLAEKNLTANLLKKGDILSNQSDFNIEILRPDGEVTKKRPNFSDLEAKDLDFNGFSLVEMALFGNFKMLLTSDSDNFLDKNAVEETGFIDVLQVPHHGSKNGLTQDFLKRARPKLAVISVGKNNSYGHPAKETLELLKKYNVRVLRTDKDGEIEIVSDGKSFWVN